MKIKFSFYVQQSIKKTCAKDKYGKTTLMITCKNGHKEDVQLLETNIDLIVWSDVGITALMFAY